MANILFVKANDRPADQAISVQMYNAYLNAYKEANPNDTITELDLYAEQLPHFGNDAITGNYKLANGYELTAAEQRGAETAARYLNQFLAADKIVIAFPLWNYTAPSPLISYISYLAQVGKTFKYTESGPVGLAGDKKVALLSARGGDYSVEPMSAIESAIRPIKAVFGLFGIQTEDVVIEGHNQFSDRSADIVADGLREAAALAAGF